MHRLFTKAAPKGLYEMRTPVGEASITWLGTAGFIIRTPDRTLVLDPYVSRPSLAAFLSRPLRVDEELSARLIPKADDVLIGHSHFDHILDAPALCLRTGARLIGCSSACNVGRAGGVPEAQLHEIVGREEIPCGDNVVVRGLPSAHGRIYFNHTPLPGPIPKPPPWPPRNHHLRCGQVFNWHIRVSDPTPQTILHVDSAEFFVDELRGVTADVVCLCAIGRNYRPRYVEEILALTGARYVIPCHWDWMFGSIEDEVRQLPGVNLEGFVNEIREEGASPVVLPPLATWSMPSY